MNRKEESKSMAVSLRNSVTLKLIVMVFLVLLLLIPTSMVSSLIKERKARKEEVIGKLSSKWGDKQTITGPIISIPYKKYNTNDTENNSYTIRYMHFLPDSADIRGRINPEIRYLGIYETVLYKSSLSIKGVFPKLQFDQLNVLNSDIIWDGVVISLGIADMRGVGDQIKASINGDSLVMNPGLVTNEVIKSGVSSKIGIDWQMDSLYYEFDINLNGSQRIDFIPVGKQTTVSIESGWPDPGFDGAFLPVTRDITESGFSASWKILDLNRNYPQYWTNIKYDLESSAFGIKLAIPVDIYQKSTRTVKYALMFIVFAFTAFFFSEVFNRIKLHPIQYLLIGLAIVLFYSLLISISEHTNFDIAYWISCLSIIGLITGYSKSILKKARMALMVGGILTVLYGFLYIILQLEDYALLMGSIGLFVVLGLVMFFTRKIDWYDIKFEK